MRIRFDEIPDTGLTLELLEKPGAFPELAELADSGECVFIHPLTVDLKLAKAGRFVEMRGRIRTRAELSCTRCLKPFQTELATKFRLNYTHREPPRENRPPSGEIELTAEDVGLVFFDDDVIDTRQTIFEETLAAIPIRPLCRENCKGLCQNCGEDLNEDGCQCGEKTDIDPRLAPLLKFRAKPESGK